MNLLYCLVFNLVIISIETVRACSYIIVSSHERETLTETEREIGRWYLVDICLFFSLSSFLVLC